VSRDADVKTGWQDWASTYPVFAECLPGPLESAGRYEVRFATRPDELDAIQRLRFEVFNLEMGEGLEESYATGRDRDRFDAGCHHLMVIEAETHDVVGTYRIQTSTMAAAHAGFYSAEEFTLDSLPFEVVDNAIEVGRASVAKSHRNRYVLFLLWRGLAAYMQHNRKRFLFGCCSLTSQDPAEGKRVMDFLAAEGHVHSSFRVHPQPGWECYADDYRLDPPGIAEPVDLPRLFKIYLRHGARVCGLPAIDRRFKTIDYLVVLDVDELDPQTRGLYFR
jgi:putative hemolysin